MINSCKEEQEYRPNQHKDKGRHRGAQPEQYMEPILDVPVIEAKRLGTLVADAEGIGRLMVWQIPHDEPI